MKPFQSIVSVYTKTRELLPLTLLVILSILFYALNTAFLSAINISTTVAYISELGMIALPMTLLLTAAELDLSVGSVFAFCPVLMFTLYNVAGINIVLGFFIAIAASALVGFVNAFLVTRLKISSLLVTIGMMLIVRGIALFISNGFPQSSWSTKSALRYVLAGSISFGDVTLYTSLGWFLLTIAVIYFLYHHTRFGNWISATGGNQRAAEARGIITRRVKVILFVLISVLSGFAGCIDSFRISSAYPVAGTGYELDVIAMTVIGGTSLFGGRGTIIGTVLGVILLQSIRNGIIIVGVPGLAYDIFVGLIIIIMMIMHSFIERSTRGDLGNE